MADPIYQRIAADLRTKIQKGRELEEQEDLERQGKLPAGTIKIKEEDTHRAGAKLKPEQGLQEEYRRRPEFTSDKISRNTVRDAIELLVLEGLIEKRHGRGTFVAKKIIPIYTTLSGTQEGGETAAYTSEVTRQGRERKETKPKVELEWGSAAPELELPARAPVISRHQERFIDGKPYSLQTSYYPQSYVVDGAVDLAEEMEIESGAVDYIKKTLDVTETRWRDDLQVRLANRDETEFFDLPPNRGAQLLEARRTAFDNEGKPIRLTVTLYAADRNHLIYDSAGDNSEHAEAPTSGASRRPDTKSRARRH